MTDFKDRYKQWRSNQEFKKGKGDALAELKKQMAAKKVDMSGDGFSKLEEPKSESQKWVDEIMAPYRGTAATADKRRLDEIRANIVKNTKQPWLETGFKPEYTPKELAVVVARNRANADQQQSSIQEYNTIAEKHGLPAWDASTPKTGNKTGTKTTQTEYTDKEIQRILTSGTPAEQAALDAYLSPKSDNPKPKPAEPAVEIKMSPNQKRNWRRVWEAENKDALKSYDKEAKLMQKKLKAWENGKGPFPLDKSLLNK